MAAMRVLLLLMYVFTASLFISWIAAGMGYIGVSDPTAMMGFSPSTNVSFGQTMLILAKVMLWKIPESLCPLWVNIMAVKIPLIALGLSVYEVFVP